MTLHRRPRRPFGLALWALAALALLAGACTDVASPEGWASPVQSDDDLLLLAHRDELFALTGDMLAPRRFFPPLGDNDDLDPVALYGTPAVTDDAVFVPTYDGILYALDAETSDVDWLFDTEEPLIGGVVASLNTVYFGSTDGNVYALDAASGALRWEPFETGEAVWSTPALAGGTLYVTSLDGRLYAIDPATGIERWSFSTDAGIASPPVVDEEAGLVYVGGLDSHLRAIDIETHEERWALKVDNWFWTRPLVVEGIVYAGSLDGNVYAIEAESGDPHWPEPFSAEAPVRSAPVMAGGLLIIIDRDGNVYGIDPSDGSSAVGGPLALGSDVLVDPVVRIGSTSDGDADAAEVVIVTTEGELIRIDSATLQPIGRAIELED